jgi:hypothetical protein
VREVRTERTASSAPGRRVGARRATDATTSVPAGNSYLPLKTLATYAGLSVRTLRAYLYHRTRPLPHYRIGGKIVVRQSDFDTWAAQFRVDRAATSVDALVEDIVQGLG